jgi:hypothetical protein
MHKEMSSLKWFSTIVLGFMVNLLSAQTVTSDQLQNVFEQSLNAEKHMGGRWTACNKDSMFFKADTVRFYNSANYMHGFSCCHYINWRFTDRYSFRRNLTEYCSEPPGETVYFNNGDPFTIRYISHGHDLEIHIYQKDITESRFRVLSLDKITLQDGQDCDVLTLLRLH